MFKRFKTKVAEMTLIGALGYILLTFILALVATLAAMLVVSWFHNPLGSMSIRMNSTQESNTITVDGQATITTVPDEARLNVGISSSERTVADAQNKTNQVIANVTAGLKELGVTDAQIKTNNYSVYPNYDYSGDVQRITGYTVSQNLNVTVTDFDKLNQVIDLATSNGANQVGGISFNLSQKKLLDLEDQAREQAIAAAKAKAVALADGADIKLGKIVNIYENNNSYSGIETARAAGVQLLNEKASFDAATSEVSAGSTDYTYTINLTYELE